MTNGGTSESGSDRSKVFSTGLDRGTVKHRIPDVEVTCPFEERQDCYDVTVTIQPKAGWVPEIHWLKGWLHSFKREELTQEDFTQRVFDHLWEKIDPTSMTVHVNGFHRDIQTETEVSR